MFDAAVSAGLVSVEDAVVRFKHPLIRSSIYQRLTATDRRAGHDALARAVRDPERATWHRAAAALGPDSAPAPLAYGAPFDPVDDVLKIIASVRTWERDATTTYQVGHAAACVGAFDVSEALFTDAVQELRAEARPRCSIHTTGIMATGWVRQGRSFNLATVSAGDSARPAASSLRSALTR